MKKEVENSVGRFLVKIMGLVPFLLTLAAGTPPSGFGQTPAATASTRAESAFSFATVRERARQRAATEYRAEPNRLPQFLKSLGYDHYQMIRFRPETGPWAKDSGRFSLQFFHPGYLYQNPVAIHLVDQSRATDFHFSPTQFDYGRNQFPEPVPADLPFAGLRVLYPLNTAGKQDEVVAFLGASYFRVIGAGQRYGVSARGLAIDTAEPTGEEFPALTEFWVERPPKRAGRLELYALLDSPSAAGAYHFLVQPAERTVVDVEASLFLRKGVKKIGLAPLTSMFLMGASRAQVVPDFRPQVHDSDGLLLEAGNGEWLWRPLANPTKAHHLTRWAADNPKGFGLMQRERAFHEYEDLAARFDLRPSQWVTPRGDWGTGAVELVEIPTPNEWNDNIVAYWVPAKLPAVGQEFRWSGSFSASLGGPQQAGLLLAQVTRLAPAHDRKPCRFVIDFAGGKLSSASATDPLEAKLVCSAGHFQNLDVLQNEITRGWRVVFDFLAEGRPEGELRLLLHRGGQAVSETWVYNWSQSSGMGGL